MNAEEIQKILDLQKEISPIHKKTSRQINSTIRASYRQDDIEYKQKLKQGIENRSTQYQKASNTRPEVRAKISQSLKGVKKTTEHKQKLKQTTTNRYGNDVYEHRHKAGLAKRDRKFHAGEYGIFVNRTQAAIYARSQGLANAVRKFETWTKTRPEEYYFIENNYE
jgi:hypothetical protein